LGRQEEAINHFQEAIRLRADQAEYYANLGFALQSLNRLPEANAAWEYALKIKPDLIGVKDRLTKIKGKK